MDGDGERPESNPLLAESAPVALGVISGAASTLLARWIDRASREDNGRLNDGNLCPSICSGITADSPRQRAGSRPGLGYLPGHSRAESGTHSAVTSRADNAFCPAVITMSRWMNNAAGVGGAGLGSPRLHSVARSVSSPSVAPSSQALRNRRYASIHGSPVHTGGSLTGWPPLVMTRPLVAVPTVRQLQNHPATEAPLMAGPARGINRPQPARP